MKSGRKLGNLNSASMAHIKSILETILSIENMEDIDFKKHTITLCNTLLEKYKKEYPQFY